eukprot:scaffold226518_cov22-Tisochrysis_lutea.AAC.1
MDDHAGDGHDCCEVLVPSSQCTPFSLFDAGSVSTASVLISFCSFQECKGSGEHEGAPQFQMQFVSMSWRMHLCGWHELQQVRRVPCHAPLASCRCLGGLCLEVDEPPVVQETPNSASGAVWRERVSGERAATSMSRGMQSFDQRAVQLT